MKVGSGEGQGIGGRFRSKRERGDRGAIGPAAASGATKRPRCIVRYSVTGISDARYSDSAILFFFSSFLSPLDLFLLRPPPLLPIPFTSNLSLDMIQICKFFDICFSETIIMLLIVKY